LNPPCSRADTASSLPPSQPLRAARLVLGSRHGLALAAR
jgi:hypothetical protein